jgi:hypothetical protein
MFPVDFEPHKSIYRLFRPRIRKKRAHIGIPIFIMIIALPPVIYATAFPEMF